MFYELITRYDARKSFYGKAQVQETKKGKKEDLILYSYNTIVARILRTENKSKYIYLGKYSQTTTRHQKEFFKQEGLTDAEIKTLFKSGELIKEC